MIRVGLIGYGYWGPNLARNIAEHPRTQLVAIGDTTTARLRAAFDRHPTANHLDGAKLDAVVIATPPATHYQLVKQALLADRHVLVAKPLARTVSQAEELAQLAETRGLVLMVDHTFVHTAAVQAIARLARNGELGEPLYYDSVRVNLGIYQHDADVVWDLAPHDLSIVRAVFPDEKPTRVTCNRWCRAGHDLADLAYLTVEHESGFVAHAHLSWLSPVKVRRALVAGSRRMVVYDDMEPSEKVRVYDTRVDVDRARALVDYRVGDCHAPHLDPTEALKIEIGVFATRIEQTRAGGTYRADGLSGPRDAVEVVRLLEAAHTLG